MKGKYAAKAGIIRIEDAGPQCRGLAPIAIGKRVQPGGSSLSAFSGPRRHEPPRDDSPGCYGR